MSDLIAPGLWRSAFSGKDNQSIDIARVLGAASFAVFWFLSGYNVVVHGQPFDPITWGTGITGMFVGLGGALALKRSTEPGA